MQKMAVGALIVAGAYLLLAVVSLQSEPGRAGWLWLVFYFVLFTLGELYIFPTGLGLFARLAPPGLSATTIAAWYLTIFSGSLSAGAVGALWSSMTHGHFFLLLTIIAILAAAMLWALDRTTRRIERAREIESSPIQPEFS
jgi:POT family proton-dependent oligopeptide transporter